MVSSCVPLYYTHKKKHPVGCLCQFTVRIASHPFHRCWSCRSTRQRRRLCCAHRTHRWNALPTGGNQDFGFLWRGGRWSRRCRSIVKRSKSHSLPNRCQSCWSWRKRSKWSRLVYPCIIPIKKAPRRVLVSLYQLINHRDRQRSQSHRPVSSWSCHEPQCRKSGSSDGGSCRVVRPQANGYKSSESSLAGAQKTSSLRCRPRYSLIIHTKNPPRGSEGDSSGTVIKNLQQFAYGENCGIIIMPPAAMCDSLPIGTQRSFVFDILRHNWIGWETFHQIVHILNPYILGE